MSGTSEDLREFVGFVWWEDFWERTGLLVLARDLSEAGELVSLAYGDAIGVSFWNEEDAQKLR